MGDFEKNKRARRINKNKIRTRKGRREIIRVVDDPTCVGWRQR